MSVNASLGMLAAFCCFSVRGDPGIPWKVNGIYVNRLPVNTTDIFENVTVTTNGSLNCLFIQASEQRNNTVVECVIKDLQGNHEFINATLTVQGWFQLHNIVVAMCYRLQSFTSEIFHLLALFLGLFKWAWNKPICLYAAICIFHSRSKYMGFNFNGGEPERAPHLTKVVLFIHIYVYGTCMHIPCMHSVLLVRDAIFSTYPVLNIWFM